MTRFARERRAFFVEEPVFEGTRVELDVRSTGRLFVAVPHLPAQTTPAEARRHQRTLVDNMMTGYAVEGPILWFYTPMALEFAAHIPAIATVYDCMDELSAFDGAPPEIAAREAELLRQADIVFTGGHGLYDAKRPLHPNVHAFPSSVDAAHFAGARPAQPEPVDQAHLPHPRIGYFGVIDERIDTALLAHLADARPGWEIVMIGPTAKIDPTMLPRRPNLHWLGRRPYESLPAYLAGWDVAIMPFALNDSTHFISPTKTLEYLAAGKPVVSTAVRDVVRGYGHSGVVRIADRSTFVEAIEGALREDPGPRRAAADALVAATSWDRTWAQMSRLVREVVSQERVVAERSARCSTI